MTPSQASSADNDYVAYLQFLAKNPPSHQYLLLGTFSYMKQVTYSMIKNKLLQQGEVEIVTLFGDEIKKETLEGYLNTPSFFYPSRLVHIRHFFMIPAKELKEILAKDWFQSIDPSVWLVAEDDGQTDEIKTSMKKAFQSFTMLSEVNFTKKQMIAWLKKRFQLYKEEPSESFLVHLAELFGSDIDQAFQMVDTLALSGLQDESERENKLKQFFQDGQEVIFHLSDQLLRNQPKKAVQILNRLLRDGKTPEEIFYYLVNHYLFLSEVKFYAQRLKSKEQVVQTLRQYNRYRIQKVYDDLESVSETRVNTFLKALVSLDIRIKTGQETDLANGLYNTFLL
jgi:DNA polymerase III delta subunit